MNNEEVEEFGEMLQIPVITNAPNVGPVGPYTVSMYPDYEFVNDITMQALKSWDIKKVALVYDGKKQQVEIKDGERRKEKEEKGREEERKRGREEERKEVKREKEKEGKKEREMKTEEERQRGTQEQRK